jgi:hypothetical protein
MSTSIFLNCCFQGRATWFFNPSESDILLSNASDNSTDNGFPYEESDDEMGIFGRNRCCFGPDMRQGTIFKGTCDAHDERND